MNIFLVEITAISPAGSLVTLRYSSGAAYMTQPSETPPNTAYEARLLSAGNYERHAWQRDTTRGAAQIGYGTVEIDNSDGRLDQYRDYGFDGQSLAIRFGDSAAAYPSGFTTTFSGTVEALVFGWRTVTALVRDMLGETFQLPIQAVTYGGSNAGAVGVDGLPTDLQGKYKPILLGQVLNISPPCVNTSTLIYQITDRTNIAIGTVSIAKVYDKGVALTAGTVQTSLALLVSTAPTAGTYNVYDGPEGCFIRLGSTPQANVTVDASEGTTASNTVAQIVSRILTGPGGQPAASIAGAANLDRLSSGPVGIWIDTGGAQLGDVINQVLMCCNGYLIDSRAGGWALGALQAPTGTANATISAYQIKDASGNGINVITANDLGSDAPTTSSNTPAVTLPLYRVIMNYSLNNTVQTEADIAGAGLSRLGFTKQQYRQVDVSNPAIKAIHALSPMVTFTSLFLNQVDALAEANRQLAMRSIHRDVIELVVDLTDGLAIDLMMNVQLVIPRFDWLSKLFVVIGIVDDLGSTKNPAKTTLILWG